MLQSVGILRSIRHARKSSWAALLLTAFVAQALIPAGFMPGAGGLILCPGYSADITTHRAMGHDMPGMDMPDMPGMDHHGGDQSHKGETSGHEGSSLCPFAAAATPMVGSQTAVHIPAADVDSRIIALPPLPFVPRGTIVPIRLPRGPPSLA